MINVTVQTIRKQTFDSPPKISIIIPLKDRCGVRLQNCLRGIQLQTHRGIEPIIVDYGSTQKNHEQLLHDIVPFECTLYRYPTEKIWSPAIAKNIGIRRAQGDYIATLDADCIMEPRVIEKTLTLHKKNDESYIETKMSFLHERLNIGNLRLPKDFDKLRENYSLRKYGFGSYLSVHRSWWLSVRGCDERMQGWGGNDDDIRTRVGRNGYNRIRLNQHEVSKTMIFHQWHPPSNKVFITKYGDVFKNMWKRNVSIIKNDTTIIRNKDNDSWGVFG